VEGDESDESSDSDSDENTDISDSEPETPSKSKVKKFILKKEILVLKASGIEKARLDHKEAATEARNRFGNRPLENKSIMAYNSKMKLLEEFLVLIGDYESALIFADPPVEYPPSINPVSIGYFLTWKTGKNGAALLDGSVAVKDALNRPILCQGGWNAPVNLGQFFSAVNALHGGIGMGQRDYEEKCENSAPPLDL
jgi:hypothetical protein